jgi:hypothetical protein
MMEIFSFNEDTATKESSSQMEMLKPKFERIEFEFLFSFNKSNNINLFVFCLVFQQTQNIFTQQENKILE